MSIREQQFLDSRIFGSKTSTRNEKAQQTKNIYATRTEEETFQNESFYSDKPSGSIYDQTKEFGDKTNAKSVDVGSWITVIGTIPGHTEEIIQFFSKYGTILRVDDTVGNWVYIEYPSNDIAKIVVESCSTMPQMVSNTMAVTCAIGRIRSSYVPEREEPPAHVEFNPIREGVVIPKEKKSITGSIFDSIFE